ncbi:two-component regulator propeller domain-containing protein [bacterium]
MIMSGIIIFRVVLNRQILFEVSFVDCYIKFMCFFIKRICRQVENHALKCISPSFQSTQLYSLFLIIITLSSALLQAQENNLRFKHITLDDGLSHSKVNCIFQDSQGFIWFGTNNGLDKYDGIKITAYQWDVHDKRAISADVIRDIIEDRQNRMWICTAAGGLNMYDRDKDEFHSYTSDSSSAIHLSNNDINSIVEDRDGNLWLGTRSGIIQFNIEKRTAQTWLIYPDRGAGSYWNLVNDICIDKDNILWIGTYNGGLASFDPQMKKFEHFRHLSKDPNSLSDNDVRTIYEDAMGNLWIGTYEGGLNLFDKTSKQFTSFYPDIGNTESMTIRVILDDGDGNLWLGTRNGLYNFNPKTSQFSHYYNDLNNPYSLCNNNILTLLKDLKGDLWVGTRGGISYLNTNTSAFTHFRAHENNRHYLNNRVVNSILEDSAGDLWFGTEEGGLNYLNRSTGLFTYYMHDPQNPNSVSSNNIKALLEDRDDRIWIGTYQGGISILDRKTDQFTHYSHNPSNPNSLCSNDINVVYEDHDGDIWVGTFFNGLDLYDKSTSRFTHLNIDKSINGSQSISAIVQDRYGFLWIGANESLVCRIDKNTKEITYYHLPADLGVRGAVTISEDQQDNLWFGTAGSGLYFFNRSDGSFTMYTKNNNLPSKIILNILDNEDGNLWLSTSNGLSRFNPKTGAIKNFYRENGLQSDQFTVACLKSKNGLLLFGGINGATAVNPKTIRENAYIPPVVITNFLIFNKPIHYNDEQNILQKDISQTNALKLSYKHSVFSFEFAALNYAISKQNQYAYIMEGFETEWNFVGNRNFATYTNLNPGNYTFKVKAANNDGLWNETGTSIKITITPPFWKTLWFKIILIALFAFIILHFYNYQKQKRDLLKANALAHLAQLKLLRGQMNPHFLFNSLSSIRSMILINKKQAWQMISELAEFFRYALHNYDKIEVPLSDEIEAAQNYLAIEKVRFKDVSDISFHVDDAALNCIVPTFIIQPLFENAILHGKHTGPKRFQVCMDIQYKDNLLSIDISNTGTLQNNRQQSIPDDKVHGYSLDNIQKRLNLMFKDRFNLNLYEEDGWVHAQIRITNPGEKEEN